MIRKLTAAVAGLLLVACGSNAPVNAAATKTFSYAPPAAASLDQLAVVQSPLGDALTFQGAPDATAAESFTDVSQITDSLLGSAGTSVALNGNLARTALTIVRQPAIAYLTSDLSTLDNPGCVKPSPGMVTLDGCTVTITDPTTPGKITIRGFASAAAGGVLSWDLTISVALTFTSAAANMTATVHRSGNLTVSPGSIDGLLLGELSVDASSGGQTASLAVSEAVELDHLTYQTSPSCVTSGTLEARRVWTKRPSGSTASMSDAGARITWTGCGTGTIAFSTT